MISEYLTLTHVLVVVSVRAGTVYVFCVLLQLSGHNRFVINICQMNQLKKTSGQNILRGLCFWTASCNSKVS